MTLEGALKIVAACVDNGFDKFETIYVSRKWVRRTYETMDGGKPKARLPHWDWKIKKDDVLQQSAEAWYIPCKFFEEWRKT